MTSDRREQESASGDPVELGVGVGSAAVTGTAVEVGDGSAARVGAVLVHPTSRVTVSPSAATATGSLAVIMTPCSQNVRAPSTRSRSDRASNSSATTMAS